MLYESYGFPAGMRATPVSAPCTASGAAEPGDGLDNDCDGAVDEELPNGVDDDGDGAVDEDSAWYAGVARPHSIWIRIADG